MSQQAQNILNAVNVLISLGSELETLKSEIERKLSGIDGEIRFDADDQKANVEAYYSTGYGWVLDGWHWTFPARRHSGKPGKSPKIGSLTVGIDLGRPGWIAEVAGFPVLVVAWAPLGDEWATTFEGDGLFPIPQEGFVDVFDESLIVWSDNISEEKFVDTSWMYAVPLFSIDSGLKVDDVVVEPMRRLLSGHNPSGLLQYADAIRFSSADGEINPVA